MPAEPAYSARERGVLLAIAFASLVLLDGAFVWGLCVPGAFAAALKNPVSLAFVLDALVATGLLAWLLRRWGVAPRGGWWFVALALFGGLAFAIPVALFWRPHGRGGNAA